MEDIKIEEKVFQIETCNVIDTYFTNVEQKDLKWRARVPDVLIFAYKCIQEELEIL